MKKVLYFLVFLFSSPLLMAQSPNCQFADPFCTDEGAYDFPASTDAPDAEEGPDYDCLGSEPNPAWYYMQISEPGDLVIDMFSTPLVDIDFAIWGPFSGLNGVCDSLTGDMVVDCSYSAEPEETGTIPNAQVGEIYMFLITNYSNQPCNITFEQTAGDGATDCSIIECFAEAGENVEICDGDSTLLVGSGGENYTWFPTEGLSDPNSAETMASPSETTWYFLTSETMQGTGENCYETDSVLVTVTHRPVAGGDSLISFCNTENAFDLTALLDTISDDFGVWQTSNGEAVSSVIDPQLDTSDVYQYVVLTTSFVCPTDSSFFDVTVNTQYSAGEDSSMVVCSGTPLFDMTNVLQGNPDLGGTWYYDDQAVNPIFNAQTMPDGLYTYIVTSEAPCINTSAVLLLSDNTYDHTVLTTDVSCPGYADGEISFYINGGVSPFEYSVDGGITYQSPSVFEDLISGSYSLSIRDGNNCLVVDSVSLTPPGTPIEVLTSSLDVICPLEEDATVSVESVVGGLPGLSGYSYSWFHSGTDEMIGESPTLTVGAGGYYVIVRDSMGCMGSSSQEIIESDAFEYNIIKEDISCYEGNDASIYVEMLGGGSGEYSYEWLFVGGDLPVLYQQPAGDYTLEVTDSYGCSEQIDIHVSGPSSGLEATAVAIDSVSCYGNNSGRARVIVEGGNPPFTYYWSSGHVVDTAQHLSAGMHNVTVTDASGCQSSSTINISSGSEMISTINTTPANCYGSATGSADISTTGGLGTLEYTWSTGSSYNTITDLLHGDYWVIITDEAGCSVTETAHINEADPLLVTATPTDVLCYGGNDGSVSSMVEGGNAPFSYQWYHDGSTLSTTPYLNNQSASDLPYQLEVTDAKGCLGNGFAFISEPLKLTASTSQLHPAYCQDVATAEVGVIASGGYLNTSSNYDYQWNTNWDDTLAVLSDQLAGSYTVTITDDNNCSRTHSVTIPLNPTFHVSEISSESARCYNETTGEASVSVSGGFSPYSYDWSWYSGTASNQQEHNNPSTIQTNLPAGMVSVTIIDGNGCIIDDQVQVLEPTEVLYNLDKIQDQSCHGDASACDGSISIHATGGTGNYTYTWSDLFNNPIGMGNTVTSDTITNLCVGFYYLTIVDSLGCSGHLVDSEESNPVQIIEGQEVSVSIDSDHIENNTICHGEEAINMEVLNPNPIFSYNWYVDGSYQATGPAAANLPAGSVTVEATMNEHCATTSASVQTSDPAAIHPTVMTIAPSCYGMTDGQLSATVIGGTHPLTRHWLELADTNNVAAGNYNLLVVDANNCQSDTIAITVEEPLALTLALTSQDVLCNGTNTGEATLSISGGTAPYIEQWNGANPTSLSQGSYTVSVIDAKGCEQTATTTISQPSNLTANISLSGDQLTATASGGSPSYSYVWEYYGSQQGNSNNLTAVADGTYTLVVIDANGCEAQDTQYYEREEEVTSIVEESGLIVQAYPNPMTSHLMVELEQSANAPYTLQLIDARGRIVQTHRFTQSLRLEREQLAEGIYMLQIASNEGTIYQSKIVIQNL